jgi:hypothetical protein
VDVAVDVDVVSVGVDGEIVEELVDGEIVGEPVGVGVGDPVGVSVGDGVGLGVGGGGGGSTEPIQLSTTGLPAGVHRRSAPYRARRPCRCLGLFLFQSAGHG